MISIQHLSLVTSNLYLSVSDNRVKGFCRVLFFFFFFLSSFLNKQYGFFGEWNTEENKRRRNRGTNTDETNTKVLYVPYSLQTTLGDVQESRSQFLDRYVCSSQFSFTLFSFFKYNLCFPIIFLCIFFFFNFVLFYSSLSFFGKFLHMLFLQSFMIFFLSLDEWKLNWHIINQ